MIEEEDAKHEAAVKAAAQAAHLKKENSKLPEKRNSPTKQDKSTRNSEPKQSQ